MLIQFTLYNPNVQLFTSVNLLAEFLSTGGVETQSFLNPITLQSNTLVSSLTYIFISSCVVFTSISQLIWGILYLIFIVYMMMIEGKSLMKLKRNYFRQFWSYINIGIIVCAWTSVGICLWRYRELNRVGDLFARTNGYVSVNLQVAVYVNDLFTYLLAFSCFFATVKFIRLGRLNHRLMFFVQTLQFAGRDLLSFASMFSVVFLAFLMLFYLLFVGKLWTCSSLLHTAQMLFEMMLMKFDAQQLSAAAPFLGPLSFSLFILVVVFVCMSMFVAIINRSFLHVRQQAKSNACEGQHILSFMMDRFQRAIGRMLFIALLFRVMDLFLSDIGWKSSDESKRREEYDEQMRSTYLGSVESFPEKMDQLLVALDRVEGRSSMSIASS